MGKHLLITGVNGLLGQNIVKEFGHDHQLSGMDISPGIYDNHAVRVFQQDLSDLEALKQQTMSLRPDAIFHLAAYTNVDRAESEQDLAYAINAAVPEKLADICTELDIPLIHISTDYVFSGEDGPYREEDPCDPRGVYAQSKYAGEHAVASSSCKHAIVRPNVLYGHGYELKSSFVDWLINELEAERPVRIVTDQYSNPTYARRLVQVIRTILEEEAWGTWHFGSLEVVSRYDFAQEIAEVFGLRTDLINAISTSDLNQAAPRPMQCGLVCDKIKEILGVNILNMHEELLLLKEERNAS